MIIKDLVIKRESDKASIKCNIDNMILSFWFSIDYIDYVSENYDGILLLMLPVAMKRNEKIIIKGVISYKLYHNIVHNIMKLFSIMFEECKHYIEIDADGFSHGENYNNIAIGCGLSCGVDSLNCLEDNFFSETGPYRITHVTNFNTGGSGTKIQYEKRVQNVNNFVKNTSLVLLNVDSNLYEINLDHGRYHALKNLSVVLLFQKLFKRYYYSSGFSYQDCKIFSKCLDIAYSDPILIHLFSTENLEFVSYGCQYKRNEKVLQISKQPLSYEFLDVCINGTFVEFNTERKLNCSFCSKCMRTMVVLDYCKKLDNYKKVFDLDKYYYQKEEYLRKLNPNDTLEKEIIDLLKI